MAEFHLRIVASDKVFYSGMTEIVILPGLDGEYAFMAKHEEMVVAVRPGELRFRKPDGTWQYAVVGAGVAQTANNRVIILVDSAERPEDIDEIRANRPRNARRNSCGRSSRSMSTGCPRRRWRVQFPD